jgi:glutaconyl-CoA/methylmalonyl-CoA decarboxylase subunit gamma
MRYQFTLDGKSYHVTLEEHAAGPKFIVDGTTFEPTVQRTGKGAYKVSIADRTFEFRVGQQMVHQGPHPMDLEVRRAKPELVRAGGGAKRRDGRIKPPMPGKIVEVHVKEGQSINEGEILVVLEAMKMQNDIKSPFAGRVAKVNVQAGANVEASTIMLVLEPVGE